MYPGDRLRIAWSVRAGWTDVEDLVPSLPRLGLVQVVAAKLSKNERLVETWNRHHPCHIRYMSLGWALA